MLSADTATGARAAAGARLVRQSFDAWADDFRRLTEKAKTRFERRQWREGQHDSVERLALYQGAVAGAVTGLQKLVGPPHGARPAWSALKDLAGIRSPPVFRRTPARIARVRDRVG